MVKEYFVKDTKTAPVSDADRTIQVPVDLDAVNLDAAQLIEVQQPIVAQPNELSPLAPPPVSREMSETTTCDTVKTVVTKGLEITTGAVLSSGASMLCCPGSIVTHAIVAALGAVGCGLFGKSAVVGCVNACDDSTPSALRFS